MINPVVRPYAIAGPVEVGKGMLSFDVIFSPDFTGNLGGVPYTGADDGSQSFDGHGAPLGGILLEVTAGSARVAGVTS